MEKDLQDSLIEILGLHREFLYLHPASRIFKGLSVE
jgi:hypothetical protein